MINTKVRITKQEWYARGGLKNSSLYRTWRGGRWQYFRLIHEL